MKIEWILVPSYHLLGKVCIVKSEGHEAPEEAIYTRVPHCLRRKLNGYVKSRNRCRRTEEADAVLGSTK